MSIESYLADVRTYLEGISSQNAQILAELKRLSNQVNQASQPNPMRGTLETEAPPSELKTEAPPDAFIAAVTQDVLSKPKAATRTTATKRTSKKASK